MGMFVVLTVKEKQVLTVEKGVPRVQSKHTKSATVGSPHGLSRVPFISIVTRTTTATSRRSRSKRWTR